VWLRGEVKTPPFLKKLGSRHAICSDCSRKGRCLDFHTHARMPTIGVRCHELRITDHQGTFRIVYRTDPDAVVIAAVFSKKTQKTPSAVIEACKRRLRDYDRIGREG
jgi:phage-related protein